MTNSHSHSSFVIRHFVIPSYFFFSVCSVCLRSRGLYFLSFSFSPPDFPPQRVVVIAASPRRRGTRSPLLLALTSSHDNHRTLIASRVVWPDPRSSDESADSTENRRLAPVGPICPENDGNCEKIAPPAQECPYEHE